MENKKTVLQNLKKTGFKLTPQRIAVIEFLEGNTSHPSAYVIFQEVKKKYPMISFSTVYNTLKTLSEMGEVHLLTIQENKVNFDPNIGSHHHFLCDECQQIMDVFHDGSSNPEYVNGHLIRKHQVYFYGICSQCLMKGNR